MERLQRLLKSSLLLGHILYRMKVEGEEKIPAEGGCVIALNHAAAMVDSLTGGVIVSRRPDAAPVGRFGVGGGSFQRLFRMDRAKKNLAFLSSPRARGMGGAAMLNALTVLRDGGAILIAAEGEMTWDGRLLYPLAPGAAWMALRAHVPVAPVVSVGGYDIHPRWARLPKLTGRVTIRAGEPFYLSEEPITRLTDEMLTAANDRIYNTMLALMNH